MIPGLLYIDDFISTSEESKLISEINNSDWINDLKRRVQHYGYKYDYRSRSISKSMFIGPLPDWSNFLSDKIKDHFFFSPDQLIINEYVPGQGIAPHVDCKPCFTDKIISISLGSDCLMDLIRGNNKKEILLKSKSLLLISGESRNLWYHGITPRKSDIINGKRVFRKTRISMTFRKVKI